jgi:hypothetical protein
LPSIPVSTVDTVRDYLVTNITTQIADTSVLVCYDEPGTYQPDDIVTVGDVAQTAEIHAFMGSGGAHWLEESYRVAVTISVYRANDDAQTTWKRAKALSDIVDVLVRTDPTLGGVVQIAYPSAAKFEATVVGNHAGRSVTVTKEISVQVEI